MTDIVVEGGNDFKMIKVEVGDDNEWKASYGIDIVPDFGVFVNNQYYHFNGKKEAGFILLKLLMNRDLLHFVVNRTDDSISAFPALTALAATWNPELAGMYGNALGEEAVYREKDIMLGPGVNIYRTPLNGRNFEYMSEDLYLAAVMVVPYIKEMQNNVVAA